jgi:hypothetical protein
VLGNIGLVMLGIALYRKYIAGLNNMTTVWILAISGFLATGT